MAEVHVTPRVRLPRAHEIQAVAERHKVEQVTMETADDGSVIAFRLGGVFAELAPGADGESSMRWYGPMASTTAASPRLRFRGGVLDRAGIEQVAQELEELAVESRRQIALIDDLAPLLVARSTDTWSSGPA